MTFIIIFLKITPDEWWNGNWNNEW